MTLEEIEIKIKSNELTLENIEIEDMLKFLRRGFINVELSKAFGISEDDVKKIKKKRKVSDAEFEDLVRNLIVLRKYVEEEYPFFLKFFYQSVVIGMGMSLAGFRGNMDHYMKRINVIDWENLDTDKEIKIRKIDAKERKIYFKKYFDLIDQVVVDNIDKYQQAMQMEQALVSSIPEKKKTTPTKKAKRQATKREITIYPRSAEVSENALRKSCYLCEVDPEHPSFVRRKTGQRYMEPHHLIPLDYQYLFEYSLDVEANIICLCSNCHNEIHYGLNYKALIKRFYNERKELLEQCGLKIELEELYKLYQHKKDNV